MTDVEILETFTHINGENYDVWTARQLMDSPEFYLDLVSKIRKSLVKNLTSSHNISDKRELLVAFYRSIEGGDYLYPDECDLHVDNFLESN